MPWSIDGRTAEHIVTTCDEPPTIGECKTYGVPDHLLDPGPRSARSPWDLAHLAKPKRGRRASTWIVLKPIPLFCGIFTAST